MLAKYLRTITLVLCMNIVLAGLMYLSVSPVFFSVLIFLFIPVLFYSLWTEEKADFVQYTAGPFTIKNLIFDDLKTFLMRWLIFAMVLMAMAYMKDCCDAKFGFRAGFFLTPL